MESIKTYKYYFIVKQIYSLTSTKLFCFSKCEIHYIAITWLNVEIECLHIVSIGNWSLLYVY